MKRVCVYCGSNAGRWSDYAEAAKDLARALVNDPPTLLLDESDAAFNGERDYAETLRGVLNAGHRRGEGTSQEVFSLLVPVSA